MADWILPTLIAFTLLVLPGALTLYVMHSRLPVAIFFGPGLTCLQLWLAAAVLHAMNIPWTLPAVSILLGLLCGATSIGSALLERRARRSAGQNGADDYLQETSELASGSQASGSRGSDRNVGPRIAVFAGALIGSILLLVPAAATIGSISTPNVAYDAFFHHSALGYIREGGDAFPFTALAPMYGGQAVYYPTTWHMVASLLPFDVVDSANATVMATLALLPTSMCVLLSTVFPRSVPVWTRAVIIGVLSMMTGLFLSIPATALAKGLWPFALAAALLPVAVASLVLALDRSRGVSTRAAAALTLVGAASVHPSLFASIAVVLFCRILVRAVDAAFSSERRRAGVTVLGILAVLVAIAVPVGMKLTSDMADLTALEGTTPLAHAVRTVTDTPRVSGLPSSPIEVAPVLALATLGAMAAIRRRKVSALTALVVTVVAVVLSAATQSTVPVLHDLTGPWYGARERIAPLYVLGIVVLAAEGALATMRVARRRGVATGVLTTIAIVVTLVMASGFAAANPDRVRYLASSEYLGGERAERKYLAPDEMLFIESTASDLPPDAVVLGIPRDGTPAYWFVGGVGVVLPSMTTPKSVDAGRIATYGDSVGPENDACYSAKRLGITHLYEDEGPYSADVLAPEEVERLYLGVRNFPEEYLTVVERQGDQVLYAVDLPC